MYLKSLACPGDSVGAIAGQSFGEPSTQMTLNTFHLAGHGGANVTLGIPRLRELLSTKNIKNPMMMIPFRSDIPRARIDRFFRSKQKVTLLQLVHAIEIEEELVCLSAPMEQRSSRKSVLSSDRRYKRLMVKLEYESEEAIRACFDVDYEKVNQLVTERFVGLFGKVLHKVIKAARQKQSGASAAKDLIDNLDKEEDARPSRKRSKKQTKPVENSDEELPLTLVDDELMEGPDDGQIIEDLVPRKASKHSQNSPVGDDETIAEATKEPKKRRLLTSDEDNSLFIQSSFGGNQLDIEYHLPFHTKRTLFLPIIEQLLAKVGIREIKGVRKCYLIDEDSGPVLQTEGLNFAFAWNHPDMFDMHRIESNDVQEVGRVFGIEAGRNCLAREVNKVFSHYGIVVDFRHMSLVADHMSFSGELRPLSRMGMQHAQSPLLKMSFETSMNFLIKACENKDYDNINSASSSLVVGELMKNGTGAFDVLDYGAEAQ